MKIKVTGITKKQTANETDMWRIEWKTSQGKDGGVSVFDPDIAGGFTLGHSYEVELVKKGKYNNLESYHEIEDIPVEEPTAPPSRSYGKSPETEAMVQWHSDRRTLVMQVPEYIKAGLSVPQDIQDSAIRIMREWASIPSSEKPLMPHTAGQEGASAPKPIQSGIPRPRTALDEARAMDNAFEETVATDMVAGFANRGAFFTAAYETWKLGPSEVGAIITTADMNDLSKAWQKLEEKMKERNNG